MNILRLTRFIFVLFLTSYACIAQDSEIHIDEVKTQIDSYLESEMKKRKIPGLVIGVFSKDSLLYTNAFGYADLQNSSKVNSNTRFELASVTKQFTASGILILQQEGKLNVNDKLSKYFPECPEGWSDITIHHLLNHTSGLPGLWKDGKFNREQYNGINKMTPERVRNEVWYWPKQFVIDAIIDSELEYVPGEKGVYSDVGYILLGIIIDNITGSYREFMKENIFVPSGMNDTYILNQREIHFNEARGYTLKDGIHVNINRRADYEIPSHYGIFSNIPDLQKWDKVLNTELILSNKSKQMLWDNYSLNNGVKRNYGYGWNVNVLNNKKIVNHNGVTGVEYLKLVDDKVSIVTLTNLGVGGLDRVNSWGMVNEVAKILNLDIVLKMGDITESNKKIMPVPKELINKLVGNYEIKSVEGDFSLPTKIYAKESKLFIEAGAFDDQLGILSTGELITLGMSYEYIWIPDDKSLRSFKSGDGQTILVRKVDD